MWWYYDIWTAHEAVRCGLALRAGLLPNLGNAKWRAGTYTRFVEDMYGQGAGDAAAMVSRREHMCMRVHTLVLFVFDCLIVCVCVWCVCAIACVRVCMSACMYVC